MTSSSDLRIDIANPADLDSVADLCGLSFDKMNRDFFALSMRADPRPDTAVTLMGRVNDEMACTVRIIDRPVRWGGRTIRCAGIANVATHPNHRGKGHANRLMLRAIEIMEERGFDITLLFTDLPRVYEKSGYAMFCQPWWTVNPRRVFQVDQREVTVRPFNRETDISELCALQSRFSVPLHGTLARTEADWCAMMQVFPADDHLSLVAERGGQPVAHVRVMRRPDGSLRLHEISAANTDAAVTLLAATARQCAEQGTESLLITVPDLPIIRDAIGVVFSDWSMEPRPAAMWRPLGGGPSAEEIQARAEDGSLYFWAGDRF